jgi:esterase/lipase superfamily enzyme
MEEFRKEIVFESQNLERETKLTIFGSYGFILLAFPLVGDEYDEQVDSRFVEGVSDYIKNGIFRIVYVPTIENRIWKNADKSLEERSGLHFKYNSFLVDEVLPKIFRMAGSPTPIITFGCGESGYFAGNSFFRHPDLFYGTILIDAFFDIRRLCGDYFDTNCYFNSPLDFLPKLEEEYWLIHLRTRKHIYLCVDEKDDFSASQATQLSQILNNKSIKHTFEKYNISSENKFDIWSHIFFDIVKRYF